MIRLFLIVGVIFSTLGAYAQNIKINAPRSRFGVGEYYNTGLARNSAMGGLGVSNANYLSLNLVNPALLSETRLTVLEAGIIGQFRTIRTNSDLQRNADVIPGYIAIGFPISKSWKTAFSLQPYTYSEYNTSITSTIPGTTETITNTYEGSGGLNRFSFSNGVRINKNFSIGLTTSFVFGNQEETVTSKENNTSNFTGFSDNLSYTGLQFKSGLSFRKELKKVEVQKKTSLYLPNRDYKTKKELIEICSEKKEGDTLTLKQRIKNCKESVTEMPKKIYYEDTVVNHRTFFGKEKIEAVSQDAIAGKYFILFPGYDTTVYDASFSDLAQKLRIKKFLKGINTKGYGIYVSDEAEDVTEKEWAEDLTTLILEKKSLQKANLKKEVANYLKEGSGIYFNAGLTYLFTSKLNTQLTTSENRFTPAGILIDGDSAETIDGKTTLPSEVAFGFSFSKPFASGYKKDGTLRTSTWTIGSEVFFQNGNNYSTINNLRPNDLVNGYGVRIGSEIVPDINSRLQREYFKRVFYRFGASIKKLPYNENGKSVEDFGIQFGLGLPVGTYDFKYNYPKYINLAFELGTRGSLNKGQIKENYFFTTLSFSINDKWFKKRKLGL